MWPLSISRTNCTESGAMKNAPMQKAEPASESLKQRSVITGNTDDEWELIKRFDKLIKYGDRAACEKFLAKMEAKSK